MQICKILPELENSVVAVVCELEGELVHRAGLANQLLGGQVRQKSHI